MIGVHGVLGAMSAEREAKRLPLSAPSKRRKLAYPHGRKWGHAWDARRLFVVGKKRWEQDWECETQWLNSINVRGSLNIVYILYNYKNLYECK